MRYWLSSVVGSLRLVALLTIINATIGLKGAAAMCALVIFWGDHWTAEIWLDATGNLAMLVVGVAILLFGAGIDPGDVIAVAASCVSVAILEMRSGGADQLGRDLQVWPDDERPLEKGRRLGNGIFQLARWLVLGPVVVILAIPLVKLVLDVVLGIVIVGAMAVGGLLLFILLIFADL